MINKRKVKLSIPKVFPSHLCQLNILQLLPKHSRGCHKHLMLLTFYFVAYTKSRVKTESNSNINICCKSICHQISVNAHENDNRS